MKLSEALASERVVLDLQSAGKVDALKELLGIVSHDLQLDDGQDLLRRILDREEVSSTAVNRAVAIPHARSPQIDGVVATLGIHRAGLDYDSPDGEPVHLIFLILSSEIATPAYLSVLGRTARIFHSEEVRASVLAAPTAEQILAAIADQEPA